MKPIRCVIKNPLKITLLSNNNQYFVYVHRKITNNYLLLSKTTPILELNDAKRAFRALVSKYTS